MKLLKRLRWWIVWTLFFSTVINYINRQTLSYLWPIISQEMHFSHTDYSKIVSAFQVAYALMWLVGGALLDIIGTRLGLAVAMLWWSIAGMLTAFSNSVFSFGFFRVLLGIGEGCNWPGANKVVSEWFPARERGLGVAIFDSGSSIGGLVAALLVTWLAGHYGWRSTFVFCGLLGFGWLALWLALYRPFQLHPWLSDEERNLISSGRDTALASPQRGARRYLNLLKQSNVWGIVLGRSLTDPIWWFYISWIPQYFSEARGFNLRQIGFFTPAVFIAADIGNFTGGLTSGFFIKRGMPVIRARKWVCVLSSLPILAGIPAVLTHNAYAALGLISIAVWGYASWSTMGLALPSDLFPQDVVGSVTGLSGLFASGLAGTTFTMTVGVLVDKFHSYYPSFLAAALVPLLATASVLLLIRAPEKR
jgi:MFS transporter, ACS family, aldohexuronate transporter